MRRIDSFTVDHRRLLRGLYVSRKDRIGGDTITTFDIRIKEPNREPVIDIPAMHTIEHLGATFLRNDRIWAEKTVYFGPMGCRTGFYAILKGDLSSEDIIMIMKDMFAFIATYEGVVPGASPVECGNYLCQDLPMARWEAGKYLKEVLEHINNVNTVYP